MDMLPPQAPPAIVSSTDQSALDTHQRLSKIHDWLAQQQDALPDPALAEANRENLLGAMETFWNAPIAYAPGEDTIPRHVALARQLVRIARDDASLRATNENISTQARDLVLSITRTDLNELPTHAHIAWLAVEDAPIAGNLVVWDDRRPDEILLFGTRSGWESFASVDELIADIEERLRQSLPPSEVMDEDDSPTLSLVTREGNAFETIANDLVQWHRESLEDIWHDDMEPDARLDALHDALDLYALLDPYAMAVSRDADIDHQGTRAGRAERSPPTSVTGSIVRGTHHATRQLVPVGGRVARILPGAVARQVGTRMPGRVPPRPSGSALPHPDTLLPRRFLARDVSIPSGADPLDGVFFSGSQRYIRQGDGIYSVRFDSSMQAWRLHRADVLDVRYSGPLIERLPDGTWRLKRQSGLLGGSGRATSTARSPADEVDSLSQAQVRALQGYLTDRLGLSEGIDFYRRTIRRTAAGTPQHRFAANELALWMEAMAHARAHRTLSPIPQGGSLEPLTAEGLSSAQLSHVQNGLLQRMEFGAGASLFHHMTHVRGVPLPGSITPEQIRLWNHVVSEVRSGRKLAAPIAAPQAQRVKATQVVDFSDREMTELRRLLIEELGNDGILHVGGRHYIEHEGHYYAVHYHREYATWRLARPDGSQIHPDFTGPAIVRIDGTWQFNNEVGLRGGMRRIRERFRRALHLHDAAQAPDGAPPAQANPPVVDIVQPPAPAPAPQPPPLPLPLPLPPSLEPLRGEIVAAVADNPSAYLMYRPDGSSLQFYVSSRSALIHDPHLHPELAALSPYQRRAFLRELHAQFPQASEHAEVLAIRGWARNEGYRVPSPPLSPHSPLMPQDPIQDPLISSSAGDMSSATRSLSPDQHARWNRALDVARQAPRVPPSSASAGPSIETLAPSEPVPLTEWPERVWYFSEHRLQVEYWPWDGRRGITLRGGPALQRNSDGMRLHAVSALPPETPVARLGSVLGISPDRHSWRSPLGHWVEIDLIGIRQGAVEHVPGYSLRRRALPGGEYAYSFESSGTVRIPERFIRIGQRFDTRHP